MNKFSSSFKLNEIHRVDSPFNEDIIFFREALISGEGRPENLGKMGNNRDIYCYANLGVVNFERAYQSLLPCTKIPVMPQFLGKMKKNQNLTPFKGPSLPKYKDVFKKFLYGQTSLVTD